MDYLLRLVLGKLGCAGRKMAGCNHSKKTNPESILGWK